MINRLISGLTFTLLAAPLPALAVPPATDLSVTYPALSRTLTDSPVAPAQPSVIGRFVAAPIPNPDALSPRAIIAAGPEVGPSLFRSKATHRGDGFTPDSSPAIGQQSKRVSLPGISVKVPLY